jgi:glycosyltransferase involved in cell wall biosynthesis
VSETVTAIVPTHNRTHLLATTLRTILWQDSVELEVIIVDDGSSDDVRRVIDQFGDPRVRLIRHEVPQGVCIARNRGVAEARGTWLAFCDDDDLWAPDKLAVLVEAARGSGRNWAYSGAVHVNVELRVLSARLPPSPGRLLRTLPRWNIVPGGSSNVIVRTAALASAGGWDPQLINVADWDLWARLALNGSPACVERPLVGYRIHAGNASTNIALILREARLLDDRYAGLDYGELHHYLAWVYLRQGQRRPAAEHLMRAASQGKALAVVRTIATLARGRVGNTIPVLRPRPSRVERAWMAEAETWIARLRSDVEHGVDVSPR